MEPEAAMRGRPVRALDAARASENFELFLNANTLKSILGTYRNICDLLHLKPNALPLFYPRLKAHLTSWRAKALWKKFDARANNKCYGKAKLCPNTRVLIIGAGPCGLRSAIEAQLLGAKVVVVEKRDRISRNNVLHLWPFVIDDLRLLGAKKFFGKFCAGAIDHISIRQLQCILLKVALLLGVEIHTDVSFERLIEPNALSQTGWTAEFRPHDHPVNQFEFDVVIGADGKRNTLQGFKRKELRCKLAIAITANFINKRTEAEARVEEISGVAFIFNQKFFKDLFAATGIDLENIVYYKDDTHYFVMTAKKQSLLEKGVILHDLQDTAKLLAHENVNREALMNYAREAAEFSTKYKMLDLEFAVNHYGQPDVAMFDFTSMYQAENASRIIERHGYRLLAILVGDSLLEPFWPTGSGCARGFLSSLDAGWAIRGFASTNMTPLEVLAQRESIYRLLPQTTPENLNRDYKSYTLDPGTRYPNLNKNLLLPQQVLSLYDTDDVQGIELGGKKRRRTDSIADPETLLNWIREQIKDHEELECNDFVNDMRDGRILCAIINHYRPDLLDYACVSENDALANNQIAFDVLENDLGIPIDLMEGRRGDQRTMVAYLTLVYDKFRREIPHVKYTKLDISDTKRHQPSSQAFTKNHPVLKPVLANLSNKQLDANPQPTQANHRVSGKHRKRRTLEKLSMANVDHENRPVQQRNAEKGEEFVARIKGMENKCINAHVVTEKKNKHLMRAIGKIDNTDWNIKEIEKKIIENKLGKSVNKDKEKVPKWSKEQFQARQLKMEKQHLERQDSAGEKFAEIDRNIKQLDMKLREGTARDQSRRKVAQITEKLKPKIDETKPIQKLTTKSAIILPTTGKSDSCHFCAKRVYLMERLNAEGRFFHRGCFRCQYCHTTLRLGSYMFDRDGKYGYRFFCVQHFGLPGELGKGKVTKKEVASKTSTTPEKKLLSGVTGVDLLDRVQTPERIEFDLSANCVSSDQEEPLSQMDEDEWTDRNFGASTAEMGSSDDDDYSLSDSDSEGAFEEALEEPPTQEGTLKLYNEWFKKRYSRQHDSDSDSYSSSERSSYYENSSGDDDSETATEGEDEIQAREQRKLEVKVKPPIEQTGTDTEVASDDDETSSSSSEIQNSATEISTDSEFALDDRTPTCEIPSIVLNDAFVTKTRGSSGKASLMPQKVHVKSTEIHKPSVSPKMSKDFELKLTPLVPPIIRKPLVAPLHLRGEGFALNRTQSTGGIATKVSLELKKKYLLGENIASNVIQKSGSASTLDSKLKSFHSTISDCQKLLKPSAEISASMQTFCNKLDEQRTSPLSPLGAQFKASNVSKVHEEKMSEKSINEEKTEEIKAAAIVPNETEGRPRSPVHETSIIVPQIDWSQQGKEKTINSSDNTSSTSSSDSSSEDGNNLLKKSPSIKAFAGDNLPPDSLNYAQIESQPSSINDPPKSIASEKKQLNPPKPLPNFENDLLLQQVHIMQHKSKPEVNVEALEMSGRSTPCDQITATLTETELSDWARDGMVSDDFIESDYEIGEKDTTKVVIEAENMNLKITHKEEQMECINNILCPTLANIEYMDTGSESSPEELIPVKNNGYVQFHDEDDIPEDSLTPAIQISKASLDEEFDKRINPFGGEVIDLKPNDLEKLKEKQSLFDNEEDSLIIVEKSTTDENTCSDSTVKNITEMPSKDAVLLTSPSPENNNMEKNKRMEDKLAQVKKDMKKITEQRKAAHIEEQNLRNNIEFEQHCQRLQSKVDFGNAKDSIDVRKARKQSKAGSPPKPDLIQEEKEITPIRSRKEQIELERDINKRLIEEMVMNKMRAENKSLERKRRNRTFSPSLSPCRPHESPANVTPDVLLSTLSSPLAKTASSTFYPSKTALKITTKEEALSLPDVQKVDEFKTPKAPPRLKHIDGSKSVEKLKEDARARARLLSDEDLGLSPEEKFAQLRMRLARRGKENDNENVSINDRLMGNKSSTRAVFRRSKSGDDHHQINVSESRERTKSFCEGNVTIAFSKKSAHVDREKVCFQSDPNLLANECRKKEKKNKDRERRKSITKLIADLFGGKKKEFNVAAATNASSSKGFFSRISPKNKDKAKDIVKEEPERRRSFTETRQKFIAPGNISPPPIPPLPLNYTGAKSIDDSTDGEGEWKNRIDQKSSCDTLDRSDLLEESMTSCSRRSSTRSARKAKQSQSKRHRTAQEIQRKLEENEVKTRELELCGVRIEQALRGECETSNKDESELLKQWFDLMKDITELRRYERELMVRAQELELEDRHARLQHELKDRFANEVIESEQDIEAKGGIIKEMLDIVAKRDSLIALLEDERLRYSEEDRELEEQMIAKGIDVGAKVNEAIT